MTLKRRRNVQTMSADRQWLDERDWEMQSSIRGGLGTRPRGWWRNESGRPDLVPGNGELDAYCHLAVTSTSWFVKAPPARAVERLRFLADSGELTQAERKAIEAGEGGAYGWRREVLGAI